MALVSYRTTTDPRDGIAAHDVVRDLSDSYPGFDRWYLGKALPDLLTGRGRLLVAEQDGQVVGLAIGKVSPAETKLRCIRVVPRLRGKGVGTALIDRMLAELACDRPVCTVPQDMLHDYATTFVNRYGFALSRVERGLYREDRLEYIFNGIAPETDG